MRLTGTDYSRDRLTDPAEDAPSRGVGGWVLSFLGSMLLILLGFAIAIVGVLAGLISQGQLMALFTGADPDEVSPPSASQEVSLPAAASGSPGSTAAPGAPASQQARVLRDEALGDWRLLCVESVEGGASSCSASQQLRVAETGAAVFVWRIVQDGRGGLVGVWQVPETVLLAAGLTLQAGTPQPIVMPFESCGGGTCQVIANLAPDFIETLSGAEALSASVVLTNRQNLTFPLSPEGLADALAALSQ